MEMMQPVNGVYCFFVTTEPRAARPMI